jgi:hypothetical protein
MHPSFAGNSAGVGELAKTHYETAARKDPGQEGEVGAMGSGRGALSVATVVVVGVLARRVLWTGHHYVIL